MSTNTPDETVVSYVYESSSLTGPPSPSAWMAKELELVDKEPTNASAEQISIATVGGPLDIAASAIHETEEHPTETVPAVKDAPVVDASVPTATSSAAPDFDATKANGEPSDADAVIGDAASGVSTIVFSSDENGDDDDSDDDEEEEEGAEQESKKTKALRQELTEAQGTVQTLRFSLKREEQRASRLLKKFRDADNGAKAKDGEVAKLQKEVEEARKVEGEMSRLAILRKHEGQNHFDRLTWYMAELEDEGKAPPKEHAKTIEEQKDTISKLRDDLWDQEKATAAANDRLRVAQHDARVLAEEKARRVQHLAEGSEAEARTCCEKKIAELEAALFEERRTLRECKADAEEQRLARNEADSRLFLLELEGKNLQDQLRAYQADNDAFSQRVQRLESLAFPDQYAQILRDKNAGLDQAEAIIRDLRQQIAEKKDEHVWLVRRHKDDQDLNAQYYMRQDERMEELKEELDKLRGVEPQPMGPYRGDSVEGEGPADTDVRPSWNPLTGYALVPRPEEDEGIAVPESSGESEGAGNSADLEESREDLSGPVVDELVKGPPQSEEVA